VYRILSRNIVGENRNAWERLVYKGVSRSFWTGHLEQEMQMVQLSTTKCSCIAIL
jgi:hypothetical protein